MNKEIHQPSPARPFLLFSFFLETVSLFRKTFSTRIKRKQQRLFPISIRRQSFCLAVTLSLCLFLSQCIFLSVFHRFSLSLSVEIQWKKICLFLSPCIILFVFHRFSLSHFFIFSSFSLSLSLSFSELFFLSEEISMSTLENILHVGWAVEIQWKEKKSDSTLGIKERSGVWAKSVSRSRSSENVGQKRRNSKSSSHRRNQHSRSGAQDQPFAGLCGGTVPTGRRSVRCRGLGLQQPRKGPPGKVDLEKRTGQGFLRLLRRTVARLGMVFSPND